MQKIMNLFHDIWRIAALFLIGVLILKNAAPLAILLGEPAAEPFGTFSAFLLMGLAPMHVARRVLFPRVQLSKMAAAADPSYVFLGVCIVIAAMIIAIRPVQAADLPPGAVVYIPSLQAQQRLMWPDMGMSSALAAQIEQETCPSLKSRSCWNPHAELKTSREYGFGLGQCTITARFSCFQEVAGTIHWQWSDRWNPVKQIQALIIKDQRCYYPMRGSASERDHLAFAFACYNGGAGGVTADRLMCKGQPGCDQGQWFGNVERTSYKARLAVKGYGKSFFDINREYVRNVLIVRRPRYIEAMGDSA